MSLVLKLVRHSFILIILMGLYGCPVGLEYPIGEPGTEQIETAYLGTWICNAEDPEVKKVSISEKDKNSYTVEVLEKGSLYSLETTTLSGWIAKLEGKIFFYLQPNGSSEFYHYMIKETYKGGFVSCDVALLYGGVDVVTSTEALRAEVTTSMKMAEFCVETLTWFRE